MSDAARTLAVIRRHRGILTKQEYTALKGQALAGDPAGALRGLETIKRKKKESKRPAAKPPLLSL